MNVRERRKRSRLLREEGLSYSAIAGRLGVSKATVHADLHGPEVERGRAVPNAAGPGNTRTLVHGCYSERRLGPVREEHGRVLADRYGWIDPARRALQAQRLAQVDLAAAWLDGEGGVVRDGEGRVYDVADKLSRWLGQAELWFERAEAERREVGKFDALAEVMAEGREAGRRIEGNDNDEEESRGSE